MKTTKMISYQTKRNRSGWLFVLPFLIGFFVFFLIPLIQSIGYSFSSIKLNEGNMILTYVGLSNFKNALFADPLYLRTILESIQKMVVQVPIVLIFSLYLAIILNQKFVGRTVARAIFFIPVIVISGIIIDILSSDYLSQSIQSGTETVGAFKGIDSYKILISMGIPQPVIQAIVPIVYNIFNMVWSSGVQILLFLAGLQTVPSSMYECAKIEGASAWEIFWKITLPLISPMLLMNVIYSIIDYFTTSSNPVIKLINAQSANMKFEYAAGLSWVYLLIVSIIIVIVYAFINKRVVYVVD